MGLRFHWKQIHGGLWVELDANSCQSPWFHREDLWDEGHRWMAQLPQMEWMIYEKQGEDIVGALELAKDTKMRCRFLWAQGYPPLEGFQISRSSKEGELVVADLNQDPEVVKRWSWRWMEAKIARQLQSWGSRQEVNPSHVEGFWTRYWATDFSPGDKVSQGLGPRPRPWQVSRLSLIGDLDRKELAVVLKDPFLDGKEIRYELEKACSALNMEGHSFHLYGGFQKSLEEARRGPESLGLKATVFLGGLGYGVPGRAPPKKSWITIQKEGDQKAFVKKVSIQEEKSLHLEDLKNVCQENGLSWSLCRSHGEKILEALRHRISVTGWMLAQGHDPFLGTFPRIELLVSEGQWVEPGTLLGHLVYETPPHNGVNIYGNVFPHPKPLSYIKQICGEGVRYKEPTWVASRRGYLAWKKGRLEVQSIYVLEKDLFDPGGSYEFPSSLEVRGNVEVGSLRVKGDTLIQGSLWVKIFRCSGNCKVEGAQGGDIKVGGNLKASFLEGCKLVTGGNLDVHNLIRSESFIGGSLKVHEFLGGGETYYWMGAKIKKAGFSVGAKTTIYGGHHGVTEKRLKILESRRKQLSKNLENWRMRLLYGKKNSSSQEIEKRLRRGEDLHAFIKKSMSLAQQRHPLYNSKTPSLEMEKILGAVDIFQCGVQKK